jgi:hypothetical protein
MVKDETTLVKLLLIRTREDIKEGRYGEWK